MRTQSRVTSLRVPPGIIGARTIDVGGFEGLTETVTDPYFRGSLAEEVGQAR